MASRRVTHFRVRQTTCSVISYPQTRVSCSSDRHRHRQGKAGVRATQCKSLPSWRQNWIYTRRLPSLGSNAHCGRGVPQPALGWTRVPQPESVRLEDHANWWISFSCYLSSMLLSALAYRYGWSFPPSCVSMRFMIVRYHDSVTCLNNWSRKCCLKSPRKSAITWRIWSLETSMQNR
mgnify:CR=1 FL=1